MSSYGKVKKTPTRSPGKPYNTPRPDAIIDDIIASVDAADVREKALDYKTRYYRILLNSGMPTKSYKELLVRIIDRFLSFTPEQLQHISTWLFFWEEESLTGIMKVENGEIIYPKYENLLRAVFGDPLPFSRPDGSIDLANSTIVLTISEISKPCQYGSECKRKNPIHQRLFHTATGGKRSSTRSKKRSKKRARKTHKN